MNAETDVRDKKNAGVEKVRKGYGQLAQFAQFIDGELNLVPVPAAASVCRNMFRPVLEYIHDLRPDMTDDYSAHNTCQISSFARTDTYTWLVMST